MNNKVIIDSNITPTDVKIYVEMALLILIIQVYAMRVTGTKLKFICPKLALHLLM